LKKNLYVQLSNASFLVAYFLGRKRNQGDHHLIWFICSVVPDWTRFPSRHFLHASWIRSYWSGWSSAIFRYQFCWTGAIWFNYG